MICDTFDWRHKQQPQALVYEATLHNKAITDARIVGFNPQGRVVVYSSFSNSQQRSIESVKLVTIAIMQKALGCEQGSGLRNRGGWAWSILFLLPLWQLRTN